MRNPLNVIGTWGRKAFLAIKAFEDALDDRHENYFQQWRFDRLERRVAALENALPKPSLPHPSTGRMNP